MTELISKEVPSHLQCKVTNCTREVAKHGDLVCQGHWKILPRRFRVRLNEMQRQVKKAAGSPAVKRERVLDAAWACLVYLDTLKIQLPPA